MPKDISGGVPQSKSQLNKARHDKRKKVVSHGGQCNACGQVSSSCETGTEHANCSGFCLVKLANIGMPIMASYLASLGITEREGRFDEQPCSGKRGFWTSPTEIQDTRAKNILLCEDFEADLYSRLACQKHIKIRTVFGVAMGAIIPKLVAIFENGLGEPWTAEMEDLRAIKDESIDEMETRLSESLNEVITAFTPIEATALTYNEEKILEQFKSVFSGAADVDSWAELLPGLVTVDLQGPIVELSVDDMLREALAGQRSPEPEDLFFAE